MALDVISALVSALEAARRTGYLIEDDGDSWIGFRLPDDVYEALEAPEDINDNDPEGPIRTKMIWEAGDFHVFAAPAGAS